jgi:hypothetical protein
LPAITSDRPGKLAADQPDESSYAFATWAALPAIVSLLIAVPRVCPTLTLLGDSPEMVTAAAVGGVAHAPGFPLYTLLLRLLVRLPLLELPWRANVSSALLHAAAVMVVGAIIASLTRSRLATVAGALILALASAFALGSLYAEVFPLNDLFFAAAILFALRAHKNGGVHAVSELRTHSTLASLSFVAGLASANQQIIVLAAPALAVLTTGPLLRVAALRPARLALYLGLFCAPLLGCYCALWLAASRHPALSWGDVHDLASIWRLFTRADYWEYFHRKPIGAWNGMGRRLALFTSLALASVGALVAASALLGFFAQWRRERKEAIALALAFLVSGPLFALTTPLFTATTPALKALAERFLSMPMVPLAVLAGCGVGAVERWLLRAAPSALWLPTVASGCLVLPLTPSALREDLSGDRRGIALARDLVTQTPDGSLILLTGDLYVQAADYICAVERACGDRLVLEPGSFFLPWRLEELRRRHPGIAAELPEHPGLTNVHVLVAAEVGTRAVFVMPDFLRTDPTLANYRLAPDLLLIRLYPTADAGDRDRPRQVLRAHAMLEGRDCDGCDLFAGTGGFHPAEEGIVKLAYAAAYANQAQAAVGLLGDTNLSVALANRSRTIASGPP